MTTYLKDINFRCSDYYRELLESHKDGIVNATLTRTKAGEYHPSIVTKVPKVELVRYGMTGMLVGLDLGVKSFVITSDSEIFFNKHSFQKNAWRIKKLQRELSKKKKGSKNWEKIRIKLAKAYKRAVREKEDYIHSVVNQLLERYDIIGIENLNVKGLMRNHKMARAIQEVGWGRFKQILKRKAELNGKLVVEVGRFFPSSKKCSTIGCDFIKRDLKLEDREWMCPKCGIHHDRDINAVFNVKYETERILSGKSKL